MVDTQNLFEAKPKAGFSLCFTVRYLQMFLLFTLPVVIYGMRGSLSVGIVAMTDPSVNPSFPTYNWSDKSIILSSFYWGYSVPQVLAGQIAEKFGSKWQLSIGVIFSALSTIVIPFVAPYGSWMVILCRIVLGMSQAPSYPCTQYLISKWAPLSELSRMTTLAYAGIPFASGFANIVTGYLTVSPWGWPSAFYLFGASGFLWVGLYLLLGADSPEEHCFISKDEKKYIRESQKQEVNGQKIPTPWLELAKSGPYLAQVFTATVQCWGFVTLLTELPSYIYYVLGFDLSSNGLLSSMPYFAMGITIPMFGYIFDLCINRKILSITNSRKVANTIGLVVPAIVLFCLASLNLSTNTVIILLILTQAINGATYSGFQVNPSDLSPNFSGTLMGISNTLGTIAGILGPLMVQYTVTEDDNAEQWDMVFYTSGFFFILGAIITIFFYSGETQPWNDGPKWYRNKEKNIENLEKHVEEHIETQPI